MSATLKIKWVGSFILAACLLLLAMIGGKWGVSYAAEVETIIPPHIDVIYPNAVAAGSSGTVLIIAGSNFGSIEDTRVRVSGIDFDQILTPMSVESDGISVTITQNLLTDPFIYIITVIRSDLPSIPTLPVTPHDYSSNQVFFTVFEPHYINLPIIRR